MNTVGHLVRNTCQRKLSSKKAYKGIGLITIYKTISALDLRRREDRSQIRSGNMKFPVCRVAFEDVYMYATAVSASIGTSRLLQVTTTVCLTFRRYISIYMRCTYVVNCNQTSSHQLINICQFATKTRLVDAKYLRTVPCYCRDTQRE